jgi:hypothetical protein
MHKINQKLPAVFFLFFLLAGDKIMPPIYKKIICSCKPASNEPRGEDQPLPPLLSYSILPQIRQNFYILGKNKTGFKPVNPSGAAAQGARQFPVCP